ncbi:MAG TPA: vWA domain-containing protein [Acidimicrobiales bacterium]|nr:vWA domain-containing protein [Acidimicrobiales bacterium]
MTNPAEVEQLLADQASRTTSRRQLARDHPRLEQVSPDVGQLDEDALGSLADDDPDEAASLLADLARATDPALRAAARAVAARLLVPPPRHGDAGTRSGAARVVRDQRHGIDLDLDATVARVADAGGDAGPDELRWQAWRRPAAAYVLLVDASGSVTGRPLATAVTTAAALAGRLRPDDELAVIAFWSKALVLRHVGATTPPVGVLDRLFDLRGGDVTDLARGLRAALAQAGLARAARREVLVLTDGLANEGDDPLPVAAAAAGAGAVVHVLAVSGADDAVEASRRLAGAGGGRWAPLLAPSDAPGAVAAVLGSTA